MPSPIIGLHVAEGGVDATLCGDSVRASREQLCNARSLEASLSEAKRSTETGTAGTDNNGVVCVINHSVSLRER